MPIIRSSKSIKGHKEKILNENFVEVPFGAETDILKTPSIQKLDYKLICLKL